MGNSSFSKALIHLTDAARDFLDSLETLCAYKDSVQSGVRGKKTPGKQMIYEGKKLRIKEMDSELLHLKKEIVKSEQIASLFVPSVLQELDADISSLIVKKVAQIKRLEKKLSSFKNKNPWKEDESECIGECLWVMSERLECLCSSFLPEILNKETKTPFTNNPDILSDDEIDALLTSFTNNKIEDEIFPNESESEKHARTHGIKSKPKFGFVSVTIETWLDERILKSFNGWNYALRFVEATPNKKLALLKEIPYAHFGWISRHKEFLYEFDGTTIREQTERTHIERTLESEEYMGEVPPDIPTFGWMRKEMLS